MMNNIYREAIKLILEIIFYIIILIIFLMLLVISLPYSYQFSFDTKDKHYYSRLVKTIFFELKYHKSKDYNITYISFLCFNKIIKKENESNKMSQEEKEELKKLKKNKSKTDKSKSEDDSDKSFPFKLITRDNLSHLLSFLIKEFKLIKPDNYELDLILSFSDPYHNGLTLALYHSLLGVYPNLPVSLKVDWQKEVVEAQGKAVGKIFPIIPLAHLLIFILTPKTIKILWQLYKHNK